MLRIDNLLIQLDKASDLVPVWSTITNLRTIFLQYAVIPYLKPETVQNNHYFHHIKHKLYMSRLLVPVFGNLDVHIWRKEETETTQKKIKQGRLKGLENLPAHLRDSEEIVSYVVEKSPNQLQYASPRLKASVAVCEKAFAKDPFSIKYASEEIQNNPSLTIWAYRSSGYSPALISSIKKTLEKNQKLVASLQMVRKASKVKDIEEAISLVSQDGMLYQDLNPFLKLHDSVFRAAIENNGLAIQFSPYVEVEHIVIATSNNPKAANLSKLICNNKEEVCRAYRDYLQIKKDPFHLKNASSLAAKDPFVVEEAFMRDPNTLSFADQSLHLPWFLNHLRKKYPEHRDYLDDVIMYGVPKATPYDLQEEELDIDSPQKKACRLSTIQLS